MAAMTGKGAKSPVTGTPLHHSGVGAKSIPNYLRPSIGSCHDACKHGNHHEFEEKEAAKAKPRPRKQPSAPDEQKRRLIKMRSVSRRRVGDVTKPAKDILVGETVEWKDIVAYDSVPVPADGNKRDVVKGKNPFAKTTQQEIGVKEQTESRDKKKKQTESLNKKLAKTVRSTLRGKASTNPQAANGATKNSPSGKDMAENSTKTVKPPKAKKTTPLPVEKKDMVLQETASVKQGKKKTLYPPEQEEHAAIAESSRPIPAHRRAKSMSMSSRSVRFPFVRQPSKNSATFKLRSKSSKAPILPSEEEKPTWLRFRKGRAAGEESSSGIQLRIRSLRRRGSGVSGGAASGGFVVPEVTLRHHRTLEKKKSRRLYNNLIEETASKLAKSKKSRVKSLVGAFETLISKIGK
uniref:Uncharacterized protein n=1 Tax=Avena sativa TaxID=4498 RepID=A0ACD5YL94_AVESA